jgi:PAS domain S-box-containing protein
VKEKDDPLGEVAELHGRAEERLKQKRGRAGASPPESDIHRLYHELRVHQVELEMQNEELRSAQVQLEESRSRYECLYDFSPVGYLTFDRKGCIEAVNLTGAALLGLERQRLLMAPFAQFVQPDSVNPFLAHIDQVFRTGTKHACELRLSVKDRRLHVAMESIAVECDDGDSVQCHSAIMDVTERKEAEEVLTRYELLAGHSRDIILFLRRDDGRILDANAAALKAYGYSREELLAMTIYDLRALQTTELIPAQMAKANGQGLLFETVHRRKNGRTFPVEVSSQGATVGEMRTLISVIRDITRRKVAEKAVRESEELFRTTFDKSPIGTAMVGLDRKITRVNREFCSMLGYAEEEIVGLTLHDVTHPDDIEIDLENLQMLVSGKIDHFTMEKRYLCKNGRVVWGNLTAGMVRDSAGRPLYCIGMIEDITDKKRMGLELQERTVELENANKELESFSYSVSHDLRAPLRAIDGYSRMILKRQGDRFDDDTRRQFSLIRDNTRTMGQLIDDILAFSRLGRQAITASRIDMGALAGEIWNELRTINPERAMVLNIEQPPFGMGDRALIKQVLTNLLSNAVKFTRGRDGAVITFGGRVQGNEIVYSVRDNGTGFDMKYYDKLFGVFQRLHNANEFEGTGVGLAIVQRVIHRHGGRVWAEGEPDRGATFFFTLPARTE